MGGLFVCRAIVQNAQEFVYILSRLSKEKAYSNKNMSKVAQKQKRFFVQLQALKKNKLLENLKKI